jgi:hypothetical protein
MDDRREFAARAHLGTPALKRRGFLSMATEAKTLPVLYYHDRWSAYECLGCGEMLEVPSLAFLKIEGKVQRVPVRNNPENLMLWRELHEIDHGQCRDFKDEKKAVQHREYRGLELVKGRKWRLSSKSSKP